MDGRDELYRLPDESKNLADVEPSAVEAMKKHIAGTMKNEDYWMVHTARVLTSLETPEAKDRGIAQTVSIIR